MSYYYNYYIGYSHDGKLYPLGPYTAKSKLKSVVSKSRSFASDLHESFFPIREEMISDELRKEFEYTDWDGKKRVDVEYLEYDKLPSDNFVKSGYFLIDDVKRYEEDHDSENLFYDHLTPTVYLAMANNEIKFGKPGPVKDDFDEEYVPKAASDYMYFSYPDYHGKEYEVFVIKAAADILWDWGYGLPEGSKLVILKTEG